MVKKEPKIKPAKVHRVKRPVSFSIKRHIVTGFIVLGLLWIASAVYYVNTNVLTFKDDPTYESQAQSKASLVNFDQETIEKMKVLQTKQAADSNSLPSGRVNPFTSQ